MSIPPLGLQELCHLCCPPAHSSPPAEGCAIVSPAAELAFSPGDPMNERCPPCPVVDSPAQRL